MSSPIRRFEKRILKNLGYARKRYVLVREPMTGEFRRQPVSRGGMIHDPEGQPIGYHWPRLGGTRG